MTENNALKCGSFEPDQLKVDLDIEHWETTLVHMAFVNVKPQRGGKSNAAALRQARDRLLPPPTYERPPPFRCSWPSHARSHILGPGPLKYTLPHYPGTYFYMPMHLSI